MAQNIQLSLQSTVSKLLADKSCERASTSTTSTNLLEKYYGTQPPVAISREAACRQYGVPADGSPHVDVVLESVRKNIVEGKYINLTCLLIPKFEALNFTTNEASAI